MYKIVYVLICCFVFVYGGNKELSRAKVPVTPIIPKNQNSFYVGIGSGYMSLKDSYTKEVFDTYPVIYSIGYRYGNYIAIEARYIRSVKVRYDGGHTVSVDNDDFPTVFENKALYLKPIYPINDQFEVYALLGYAEVSLSDIKNADRRESSCQFGVGMLYQVTDSIDIFVDYVSLYDDKGFDGRAMNRDIVSDVYVLGVSYAF